MSVRAASRILTLGAIAVVLGAATFRQFDLDRFFVPKEIALHLTALLAGLLLVRRMTWSRVDLLLAAFAGWSLVSAALATNVWLGFRALAITASSIVLFWCARTLSHEGMRQRVVNGLALAVVVAAATSLVQAYGVDLLIFSDSRAPGGTLGNRNFVAHVAAFGFPLLILAALRARRVWPGMLGLAMTTTALVLTRSRAAWLAFGVMALVWIISWLASPLLRRDRASWKRAGIVGFGLAIGVTAALLVPNALEWRSRDPYLDTMRRVTDYEQGSGRGRLVQYRRSLAMAVRHPIFGVGPGNWAVEYPAHVPASDPSMNDSEPGMTFNPWPSSDWIAWISERGVAAAALLALAFLGMVTGAFRQLREALQPEEALSAVALLSTLAAACVTSAFDAVLLTAVPALLVWCALGALWTPRDARTAPRIVVLLAMILVAAGGARSTAQLVSMEIYATHGDRASLERAASIDPSNFRVQLRLARVARRAARCEHALAARALFPHARAAIDAAAGCR